MSAAHVLMAEPGERVRVKATGQLAEIYEISWTRRHDLPRYRCGWSIMRGGITLAGVDQWFDPHELEKLP